MSEAKFDRHADSYEAAVRRSVSFTGQEPEFFAELKAWHLLDVVSRRLGPPEKQRALDVGCGIGLTDRFLVSRFRALSGVDVAAEAVARAAEANPSVHYSSYEGDRLPFPDASFEVTFSICVLHHVPPPDWAGFAAELARVTAPGGLVVVMEHSPWNPVTRLAVARCEFDDDAHLLAPRRTRALLAASGLRSVETRYIGLFPWRGDRLRRSERALGRLPLGAQYYAAATRSA